MLVQGNVRGLLGSLQTVLWEDSGWKPIGMGDLLEPAQVRCVGVLLECRDYCSLSVEL
jgi:hypothetical protein